MKTEKTFSRVLMLSALFAAVQSHADTPTHYALPVVFDSSPEDGVVAGDFNEDGRVDLVTFEEPSRGTYGNLINYGKKVMRLQRTDTSEVAFAYKRFDRERAADAIYAGDMNGDGHLDLVATNNFIKKYGSLDVFLGNGDGSFQPVILVQGLAQKNGDSVLADMDGDGDLDVVMATGGAVLLNHGDATFYSQPDGAPVAIGSKPIAADVNADGYNDLVLTNATTAAGKFLVQLNSADGLGNLHYPRAVDSGVSNLSRVHVVDMNQDGFMDLIAFDALANQISLVYGVGDGSFLTPSLIQVSDLNDAQGVNLVVTDANADGYGDLVVSYGVRLSSGRISDIKSDVLIQNPVTHGFAKGSEFEGTVGDKRLTADLNNDGRDDLVSVSKFQLNNAQE